MASRSDADLIALLAEQVRFLQNSATAFDSDHEDEAKRLATTLRVLLHDTATSHSVLEQLGVKTKMAYADTAQPINSASLAETPGLVIFKVSPEGGRYVPALERLAPSRVKIPIAFEPWWNNTVSKFSDLTLSRRDYVLVAANKEGGAHVDQKLDKRYEALRNSEMAVYYETDAEDNIIREEPFEGNLFLAAVRQIAYEVIRTIEEQLNLQASDRGSLFKSDRIVLIPLGTGRNDPCPCGSGRKYKKCHGG
jgi:uncharacterized protein YchJ